MTTIETNELETVGGGYFGGWWGYPPPWWGGPRPGPMQRPPQDFWRRPPNPWGRDAEDWRRPHPWQNPWQRATSGHWPGGPYWGRS